MNTTTFFEKFALFADAPNAIAKMRELVLELAVQGKLVEQVHTDESGSLLLKQINAERLAAVKARKISAMKPLPPLSEEELQFDLRHGWAAARLSELVMEIQTGPFGSALHKSDYQRGGTPVINPASLKDGRIMPIDDMAIGHATFKRLEVFKLSEGDIVMARRGEMGRCAIVTKREDGWLCGTGSLVLRMPRSLDARYLTMLIGSPMARTYLGGASVGTTMQNLNQAILAKMPVGVPPLTEQKRIVAKVDELMALCDQLEAQQREREERHAALSRASLARFSQSPTPANLNFLFHKSYNIPPAELRKTILTLAVQGKLVPQDPADEPAEVLLDRIKAAREALVVERRVRQSDEVEYSLQGEAHSMPPGWVDVHVNDVAIVQGGKRLPNGAVFSESSTPHVYIRVTDMKNGTISEAGLQYISPDVQREIARYIINKDDIYVTIAGTIGDVGCVPESLDGHNLTENAAKIVFREFERRFFQLTLTSEFVQAQFLEKTKQMAQPKLALKRIAGARFYLPPLAEQRRIVAKVDELMALVDQLEAQLASSRSTATALLDAVVAELTNRN